MSWFNMYVESLQRQIDTVPNWKGLSAEILALRNLKAYGKIKNPLLKAKLKKMVEIKK